MKIRPTIIIILIAIMYHSVAQTAEKFVDSKSIPLGVSNTDIIDLDFDTPGLTKRFKSGFLYASLSMGDEFQLGAETFLIDVTFSLTALDGGVDITLFNPSSFTLRVSEEQPEAHYLLDLTTVTQLDGINESLLFDQVELEVTAVSSDDIDIQNLFHLDLGYEAFVGFDLSMIQEDIDEIEVSSQPAKNVTFRWTDTNLPLTHYQIQVLKLFNVNESFTTEEHILADIDWKEAQTYEVMLDAPDNEEFSLEMASGTGFYVARMRPIGGFFDGGVGNVHNWGIWSNFPSTGTQVELDLATIDLPYFYFSDAEENVNWIYSRIYTENGKVKENKTYADGLLRVKQEQSFIPSKNVTLIQQTVYDHVGRATISSIPVPIPGKQSAYRAEFMKNAGLTIYTSDDFANGNNPSQVDETGDFSYYNGNSDKGIPDAKGYGFTATQFYNEPGSRVKEISGVGETHSFDGGRTTRSMIATPSEDELIAIFGDEAPSNESVLKNITIDPNNTISVSYTSKEGNVIATSLSFSEDDTNLEDLQPANSIEVNDKFTSNTKNSSGFVSSKKVILAEDETDFQIGYSIRCEVIEDLCNSYSVDCNYEVDIKIHTLDPFGNVIATTPILSETLSSYSCQNINGEGYKVIPSQSISLTAGSYVVEKVLRTEGASISASNNKQTLELQVYSITNLIGDWLSTIESFSQVEEFYLSINDMIDAVDGESLDVFTNPTYSANFPVTWPMGFSAAYAPVSSQYFLIYNGNDTYRYVQGGDYPTFLTLITPCCSIDIPIKWIPPFDCTPAVASDEDVNGFYEPKDFVDVYTNVADQEQFPDFEGYMYSYFSDCVGPGQQYSTMSLLKADLYNTYMTGWERPGTFNLMVYHMLTDVYDADGNGTAEVQYDCDALLSCWISVLSFLKEDICQSESHTFYEDLQGGSLSSKFDERYSEDEREDKGDDHDTHFDENFKSTGWLTRWLAKRKLSKLMRNLQVGEQGQPAEIEPQYEKYHLVKSFLNCSGYQFAKIITPFDAGPLSTDNAAGYAYSATNTDPGSPVPVKLTAISYDDYFGTGTAIRSDRSYPYIPLDAGTWEPKIIDPNTGLETGKPLFPYIRNPIYAFKYFEYPYEGEPDYTDIEKSFCFNDVNDCYLTSGGKIVLDFAGQPVLVPCCSADPNISPSTPGCYADPNYPNLNSDMVGYDIVNGTPVKYIVENYCTKGRIRCPYTHNDWNAGQRYSFYGRLISVIPAPLEIINIQDDLSCTSISEPNEWYQYQGTGSTCADLISGDTYATLDPMVCSQGDYVPITFQGNTTFRYYQYLISEKIGQCESNCDLRRNEFKLHLETMLVDNCYEIGACRTTDVSTANAISEEDIELIVDQIVASCKSQCGMTTYSCETVTCRDYYLPQTMAGPTQTEFSLDLGTGGYQTNVEFCDGTVYSFEDDVACGVPDALGISLCDLIDINDNIRNLSWYEYTMHEQVKDWDFEINMVSYCQGSEGTYAVACCDPADASNSNLSTFISRDVYEINSSVPGEINAGDEVASPNKWIVVELPGQ